MPKTLMTKVCSPCSWCADDCRFLVTVSKSGYSLGLVMEKFQLVLVENSFHIYDKFQTLTAKDITVTNEHQTTQLCYTDEWWTESAWAIFNA